MRVTMHQDEARVGRFSKIIATAATLFGVLGLVSVPQGSGASVVSASASMFQAPAVRQGVMTERLRDIVIFERAQPEGFVVLASSR